MTLALALTLAALALVDSTSFGTLVIPVYLLLSGGRSRTSGLLVYLATIAAFYFLVGVALMLGLSAALDGFGEALSSPAAYWTQLVLGAGLFALSFPLGRRPPRRSAPRTGGPGTMVLLGLTAGAVEVATMVPYLAAVGLMTTSGLPAAQWLPLLAGYVLVMIAPPLALMALRGVAGAWLEPRLERLRAWLTRHSASMVSWAVGIIGFLLARDAAAHLFFGA
ncbi:GAP family protein [Actinomadura sp. ATCC 31491]|uniref:GAP family protein n=1 Tax=Actinomadura luzonensis TaxID=2805427 RepID=A0ABT0G001_9ACTN|nr:GAP family protein [Actinomadura luzonensis]MCK2217882.1 GAP family protein [Actinomadura luzonensis]